MKVLVKSCDSSFFLNTMFLKSVGFEGCLMGGVPAYGRVVGIRWSLRSLPPQRILRFYEFTQLPLSAPVGKSRVAHSLVLCSVT